MGSYYFLPIYHVLVLWLSLMSLINYSVGAKYKWDVEYMFWSPDCQRSMVMGINGQFPGPTIRAKAGDTIEIELTNKLHTEGVVIHWHGIRQIGTPWADGTASISQCAINPGETFLYSFKVDKPGTYFYHGHYGMQRAAGLYGSLIVDVPEGESEPFHYNGEFNFLLTDWSHRSVHEQSVGLSSRPSHWFGEPQSLLINGRGQYNCSMVAVYNKSSTMSQCKFTGNEQCAPEIMHVLPNKTYRLRLASTTAIASLNLAIGNHTMLVVEADGNYVKPFETSDLDIYSGESYSVLIRTDQNPLDNYWITLGVIGRKSPTPPTYAILKYHNITESELPSFPPPITPPWNDYNRSKSFTNKILAKMGSPQPPKTHDRRLLLLNSQANIDGYNKLAINNISLVLPPTPYLGAIKYGLKGAFDEKSPPDNFPEDYDVMNPPPYTSAFFGNGAYTLEYNQTIDVILQNANVITKNLSHVHPWHLHGHDFWILGYGEGKFTEADVSKFNLENPPLKNTAVLFPFGWTALRFVTDNPGVWIFHCHIESHLHMGMGVIFAEAVHLVKKIPNEALTCGLTARMFLEQNHTTVGH